MDNNPVNGVDHSATGHNSQDVANVKVDTLNSRTKLFKICTIVLGVVAGIETIALVTFGVMISTKNLHIVQTTNGKKIAEVYNVCDSNIIKRWNNIYDFNSEKKHDIMKETKQLVDEVKKRPNYEKDPTCQYFIFRLATYNNDINAMQKSVESITALDKQGVSVSGRIVYSQSLDDMQRVVSQLKKK